MPRERIHHGKITAEVEHPGIGEYPGAIVSREYYPGAPDIPKDAKLSTAPSLDVSWHREGEYVQVSIDISREQWLECAKDLEETPDTISRAIYTDRLTRQEINHLIRTLRRARDAAYGKDE